MFVLRSLWFFLIVLTIFLCLTWLFFIFFWNSLVIVFNQILFLNGYRFNFSISTSSSLRNFWFHTFIFFLTSFQLSCRFRNFMNIIFDQRVVITFVTSLSLRSVLTSKRLAFNVSGASTGDAFLIVAWSRLDGFHRFCPLFNTLC